MESLVKNFSMVAESEEALSNDDVFIDLLTP